MGHSLKKRIVAEGIETDEQLELLKQYGCDEGQGYLFQRPVPEKVFSEIIKKAVL